MLITSFRLPVMRCSFQSYQPLEKKHKLPRRKSTVSKNKFIKPLRGSDRLINNCLAVSLLWELKQTAIYSNGVFINIVLRHVGAVKHETVWLYTAALNLWSKQIKENSVIDGPDDVMKQAAKVIYFSEQNLTSSFELFELFFRNSFKVLIIQWLKCYGKRFCP